MPLRMAPWKPALLTRTSYCPTGRDKTRYRPVSSVVAFRSAAVSRFLVVTLAAGTGAPDGSVTMPVMLAATCAWIGDAPARVPRRAANKHGHGCLFLRSTFAGNTAEDLNSPIECIVEPPERRR